MEIEEKDMGFIEAHLKTDDDNIYETSRAVFLAFAEAGKVLLEMTLKKANLEDVFIELTEGGNSAEVKENGSNDTELQDTDSAIDESEVADE